MKKLLTILAAGLLGLGSAYAQLQSISVTVKDDAGGYSNTHKIRFDYVIRDGSNRITDVLTQEFKMNSGSTKSLFLEAPRGSYVDPIVHVQLRQKPNDLRGTKWFNSVTGIMNAKDGRIMLVVDGSSKGSSRIIPGQGTSPALSADSNGKTTSDFVDANKALIGKNSAVKSTASVSTSSSSASSKSSSKSGQNGLQQVADSELNFVAKEEELKSKWPQRVSPDDVLHYKVFVGEHPDIDATTTDLIGIFSPIYDRNGNFIRTDHIEITLSSYKKRIQEVFNLNSNERIYAYPACVVYSIDKEGNVYKLSGGQMDLKGWKDDNILIGITGSAEDRTVRMRNNKINK